ncbi:hypothetical protein ACQPUY_11785 [Clostridium nigeriense]|uniref:hypothetical protein n=1 Tax=Clostridium nigeriense TaxID=1805470 RepID=UPI003D33B666
MLEVKPLDDVMNHFQWIFIAYIVLFIIVCINFYKAIKIRKKLINNNAIRKSIQTLDLIIDILCGLAMYAGLMFQGVLADNNALNWTYWNDILIIISMVSLIIFILNVILVVKKKKIDY